MNGPMQTVKCDEPMTWEEFSRLSESLRRQYIQGILNRYDVGPNAIARMLGVSGPYCGKRLRELGFTFSKHTSVKETARFLADFGAAETAKPERRESDLALERIAVTFSGAFSAEAIAQKLAPLFEAGRPAVVTVEIAAVK